MRSKAEKKFPIRIIFNVFAILMMEDKGYLILIIFHIIFFIGRRGACKFN